MFHCSCEPVLSRAYWLLALPFWMIRRAPPDHDVALTHAATVIASVGLSCGRFGAVTMPVEPSKFIACLAISPGMKWTVPDAVPWFAWDEKSRIVVPVASSNS